MGDRLASQSPCAVVLPTRRWRVSARALEIMHWVGELEEGPVAEAGELWYLSDRSTGAPFDYNDTTTIAEQRLV